MNDFSFTIDTRSAAPQSRIWMPEKRVIGGDGGRIERPKWEVITLRRDFPNADVDWYRLRYGKADGERRFFAENEPGSVSITRGNMLMGNGASALFQCLMGNGTSSANSALGSGPTFYNNAQSSIYVGDGGITAGSGNVSITTGTTGLTFGSSQSGLQGKYFVDSTDSTNGIYTIVSGSGTSWTLGSNYGGSTLTNDTHWSYLTAESHNQTALVGSTNTAHQAVDATFPSNLTNAQFNAITGATNVSPIVLTISGGDISTNDIVQVYEVAGNTAANGMWVANPASAASVTLLGSAGNGSYTYGGIVTKQSVWKVQSTFGPSSANFQWMEWAVMNGTGSNKIMFNRKVAQLGTKSGGSTSLQVGIGIG